MKLAFLTATPLDILRGSGTFNGISTLARALEPLGCRIEFFTPRLHLPVFTLERVVFNQQLGRRDFSGFDAVIGFDMDGYRVRSACPHIASIKGVIADEMRFEHGITRRTMAVQAACERRHVHRASLVLTTSRYAAGRIKDLYGLAQLPSIVPEAIDLVRWRELFAMNPAAPDPARFTIFSVCRFYPRKRLEVLLDAADVLRARIPNLTVRIAGGGPQEDRLRRIWQEKRLHGAVHWLGDIDSDTLAREYQSCDVFCLPSVQEGFGIVFLEAMAAGKPIAAANAAAVPEVVPQGLLAEPGSAASLAGIIARLHDDGALRQSLAVKGLQTVAQYDAPTVARRFLECLSRT